MIIGTRGSKLARWQATWVQSMLRGAEVESQLHIITTEGDQRTDIPLHAFTTTGVFTKGLDLALLKGEVDLAVHSAKDMASTLEEGLEVLAFMKREDPRDALLAASPQVKLDNLSRPLVIGTSSVRRRAMIRHYFPHVEVRDLRGNVDTRVGKMEKGDYDGIILALAGVRRMGYEDRVVQILNPHSFIPAVGQGAVAVLCRKDWKEKEKIASILDHKETSTAVKAERAFLKTLKGGCSQPVFGHAQVWQGKVSLTCGKLIEDGARMIRESAEGPEAEAENLGYSLAESVLTKIKS